MGSVVPYFTNSSATFFITLDEQLHYGATYGPSQARQTVISSVGGNFSTFLAQKLPR
ncbi:hypothetical protein MTR_0030s0430 [Medicago truncatula]|uniref:Uncharacterized protein n=1 Tax=Medicago truncatula TaxID=3880 RepID=A0A072TUL6_MEDTR|nr:hypothetical protein MTR_0030s0430 [Medicago truncatula]